MLLCYSWPDSDCGRSLDGKSGGKGFSSSLFYARTVESERVVRKSRGRGVLACIVVSALLAPLL